MKKDIQKRVLIVSALVPVTNSGAGCLTMYRHFIQRRDFTLAVATARGFQNEAILNFRIKSHKWIERLKKSRFSRIGKNLEYVLNWLLLPRDLLEFARKFQPDVIFGVVDDLHMGIGWRLSRKLRVPLAVDFQDLFAVSTFVDKYSKPYALIQRFLLNRYRFLNLQAEIVFHVGEGMRNWFKPNIRGEILFPMADQQNKTSQAAKIISDSPDRKIKILYTGNCRGSYGTMVLDFANHTLKDRRFDFKIYSLGTDMPSLDLDRLRKANIYQGFMLHDKLNLIIDDADFLLLVMGFDEKDKIFVSTSFNTKWVDYVSYGKPIIVWAPSYSSASSFATQTGCAYVVPHRDPVVLAEAIYSIASDLNCVKRLTDSAASVANSILNPDRLQGILLKAFKKN